VLKEIIVLDKNPFVHFYKHTSSLFFGSIQPPQGRTHFFPWSAKGLLRRGAVPYPASGPWREMAAYSWGFFFFVHKIEQERNGPE
jgi:hypothetical protein